MAELEWEPALRDLWRPIIGNGFRVEGTYPWTGLPALALPRVFPASVIDDLKPACGKALLTWCLMPSSEMAALPYVRGNCVCLCPPTPFYLFLKLSLPD